MSISSNRNRRVRRRAFARLSMLRSFWYDPERTDGHQLYECRHDPTGRRAFRFMVPTRGARSWRDLDTNVRIVTYEGHLIAGRIAGRIYGRVHQFAGRALLYLPVGEKPTGVDCARVENELMNPPLQRNWWP